MLLRWPGAEVSLDVHCSVVVSRCAQRRICLPAVYLEPFHGTSRQWTAIHCCHASILFDRSARQKKRDSSVCHRSASRVIHEVFIALCFGADWLLIFFFANYQSASWRPGMGVRVWHVGVANSVVKRIQRLPVRAEFRQAGSGQAYSPLATGRGGRTGSGWKGTN